MIEAGGIIRKTMINFMGNSSNSISNGGFHDEGQMGSKGNKLSFGQSSSSSPSSCSQHKGLLPLNYLQQLRENQDDDDDLDHVVRRDSMDGTGTGSSSRDVAVIVEREHMFDKVVTPSDVGKLNRLVIPKQHAERYFPLDSSTNEKGLLLNFEDRNGKPWTFRYSYWNSSQSYVMTKGWSRFVRDKKLDAGDIVSFQRGAGEMGKDRLFIDWKPRHQPPELPPPSVPTLCLPHHLFPNYHPSIIHPWNKPMYLQTPLPPINYGHGGTGPYANYSSFINPSSSSVIYFRSAEAASKEQAVTAAAVLSPQQVGMVKVQRRETGVETMVFDSVPVSAHGKAAAKKLRLFGVNMECPMSESDEEIQLPQFSSSNPALQLRPYNGTLVQTVPLGLQFIKGKSSMSLDLDI